jgi:ferredoxin
MTSIIFIHPDGRNERIEAGEAESAMLAATSNGIDGILAECGGNAMCATCHVYVDESWLGAVKTSMLQDAEHGKPIEIDALLTVTRDLGQMVGVRTPFIDGVLGLARLKATSLGLLGDNAAGIHMQNLGHGTAAAGSSSRSDQQA